MELNVRIIIQLVDNKQLYEQIPRFSFIPAPNQN
jgi:hypothetical protein